MAYILLAHNSSIMEPNSGGQGTMGGIEVNKDYAIEEILYRDANVCYARGFAFDQPDLLLCFYNDTFDEVDAEKPPTAKRPDHYEPIQGEFKLAFLPEGPEHENPRLMPAVAFGCVPGWTIVAYRFLPVLPLWIYLPKVVVIRRREALRYAGHLCEGLASIHQIHGPSGEVHAASVFIDEQRGDNAYLAYNKNLGKLYPKLIQNNVNFARFAVKSPEELWGEGPVKTTDLYHLGALLTAMVKGEYLEVTDEVKAAGMAAVEQGLYPPTKLISDLPKGLDEFVAKTLCPAAERFSSVEEAKNFLVDDSSSAKVAGSISEAMADRYKLQAQKLAPAVKKKAKEKKERKRKAQEEKRKKQETKAPSSTSSPLVDYGPAALLAIIIIYICVNGLPMSSPIQVGVEKRPAPTETALPRPTNTASPIKPTVNATQQAVITKSNTAKSGLLTHLEQLVTTPTNSSNYNQKQQFLHRCYLKLPLKHREPAIGVETFRELKKLKSSNPQSAHKELDGALRKLLTYARGNDVLK